MSTLQSPDIVVRPATTDDIEFMVHLFLQIRYQLSPLGDGVDVDAVVRGTRVATRDQVQGRVANSVTNVIECDGQKVGRLRVIRTPGEIMIGGLHILPSFQHHGIGSRVLTDLAREATSKRVPLVLEVEKDNTGAARLYDRLGFERYGETDDAYKMRRLTTAM